MNEKKSIFEVTSSITIEKPKKCEIQHSIEIFDMKTAD